MSGVFKPHGDLVVQIKDRVLWLEGKGPWNLELLKLAEQELPDNFPHCMGTHWGVLTVMHGDAMYIPSAEQYLKEQITQEKGNGRVATAVVITNASAFEFYAHYFDNLYASCGEVSACFTDVASAETWLENQLDAKQ